MTNHSFTYGTTPREVIAAELPHKYDMSLNRMDMIAILAALGQADGIEDDEDRINAESLRSSILSTLGIEEV